MKLTTMLWTVPVLVLAGACSPSDDRAAPAAAPEQVGYITLQSGSVPQSLDLRGRVVARATAEVRPQVDGIVRKIAFVEGRTVEAGDTLYEIDDRRFNAAHASAQAALKKAEAATASAQTTFDRNHSLMKTSAVSIQTLEDAQSTLLQAQASEEAARADLETARINLDNATIRAPIGGMIGVSTVSVGALVTENQTDPLGTVRQIDPINVDVADTSANLLRIRGEVDAGRLGREKDAPVMASLTLENGQAYSHAGQVSLADMVVGETTGTFTVRTSFPNPDRVLIPGMFVTATIDLGKLAGAFLVPQRAVTRDDDGTATVYLVSDDGKAKLQAVTTTGSSGNDWIVTDGVKDGDRLIVDGFQKISDGSPVEPVEATINDDGVIRQDIRPASARDAENGK